VSDAGPPRSLIGFLDALREGQVVVGWAADPRDRTARPVVRLMRGLEVLAECRADAGRDDGNPGFRLRAPMPLAPEDFLEGRVRVRVLLPGHQAAITLAMTRRMREQLEDAAGWEPTTQPASPARPPTQEKAPPPPEPAPPTAPMAEPPAPRAAPAEAIPAPGWTPRPPAPGERPVPAAPPVPAPVPEPVVPEPVVPAPVVPEPPPPAPDAPPPPIIIPQPDPDPPLPMPLDAMLALARLATLERRPVLHLLVPARRAWPGAAAPPALTELEGLAAARPELARDWVPLRHAFARHPQPATLWRLDGRSLTVEGCVALLSTLLSVLHLRHPKARAQLARAAALLARLDLAALPRRDLPPEAATPQREAFLGVSVAETEPAVPANLFADLPAPQATGPALPGLEAWSSPAAPLPWRVVVLAEPGLGGSAGPAQPGWWLRRMVAECVISEALHIAPPEAALGQRPDLLLTLAAEPVPVPP